MSKRGQAWGFDLLIASSIFFLGLTIFFVYTLNSTEDTNLKIDDLQYEGNSITEDILSEGFPTNWSTENVEKIGLTTNGKIDDSKLQNFYTLSSTDYRKTISLFDTKYNYFINFTEPIVIDSNQIEGIGSKPISPKNLVKVTRFTVYNNKPSTLNLFIWE